MPEVFSEVMKCIEKLQLSNKKPVIFVPYIKHLLDETESNIEVIASGQGDIGRSEAEPNIILYGRNQLDVGRGQVQ